MNQSLCNHLENEVKDIIQTHLNELSQYSTNVCSNSHELSQRILGDLSILEIYCCQTNLNPTAAIYVTVAQAIQRIRSFLHITNCPLNSYTFRQSELGLLWQSANDWFSKLADQYTLSDDKIWELMSPAVPDVLRKLGADQYEAIWWKPVPQMDIEIVQRTEYILIEESPFEPIDTPGSVAVRFSIHV